MKIGFIGQGWIGKNYADDFEERGFEVVRYALESPYNKNSEEIKTCDIVFIAVPTPTIKGKFDCTILKEVIKKVGAGKIAVIKSTVVPGTTYELQVQHPDKYILHSPEFLSEATASKDAKNPKRNIIGIPIVNLIYQIKADEVLKVLPKAGFNKICKSCESELIKYGSNVFFYLKVVYINMLYDLAIKCGADWNTIKHIMAADNRIGPSHLNPVHESGTLGGDYHWELEPSKTCQRGAGGHCFIKDYAAFVELYEKLCPEDEAGILALKAIECKNLDLLLSTNKDMDIINIVYEEDN